MSMFFSFPVTPSKSRSPTDDPIELLLGRILIPTGLLLANGDHPVSMMSKHLEKKTSLKPPTNIIQLSLYIYIILIYIYIYLYLYISNSMPFNPYPQSFGYPVNSVCTWPVSRTGFPTHGWSFPIHKGQLFIIANINHCQYIYYIYTIIIYILLWLLLSYYIVYC
jgi:hypothetical protein